LGALAVGLPVRSQPVSPYECAWRATPGADASFNGGPKISGDVIVESMKTCGVVLTGDSAQRLGLYFSARHHIEDDGAQLAARYAGAPAKLKALARAMPPGERAQIMELTLTPVISPAVGAVLRKAVAASGVPESDAENTGRAARYLMAQVMVLQLTR
jgi:hypothetical protein